MKNTLTPRRIVSINGKIHYSESNQAWNLLKLKSEFLKEFPQLKEKRSKFSYKFVFIREDKDLIKMMKESVDNKKSMPILMFIYRDE
jgi:hypothetical protein